MRTRTIHAGDLVLVNHLGRAFYANVLAAERAGVLSVEPLQRGVSWRTARAREVLDHWAHARPDRHERPPATQLAFDGLAP